MGSQPPMGMERYQHLYPNADVPVIDWPRLHQTDSLALPARQPIDDT